MRFSIFAMLRLIVLTAAATSLVAVGVARMQPVVTHFRLGVTPHYSVINGFAISRPQKDTEFLDRDTGEFARIFMPADDRIEFASCSPWEDDEGQTQVVGRWVHKVGQGPAGRCEGLGIARYLIPGGRVLDHVSLNVMPTGHPCWFPGLTAKVLFAAADGRLYALTFADRPDSDEEPSPSPVPISWRCERPGTKVFLKDPVWPSDPRFGGRLIVSLAYHEDDGNPHPPRCRLWWLKLDAAGREIVEAGPLETPAGEKIADASTEVRFPNLAVTPEGDFVLTYLWQRQGQRSWQLRLSKVAASVSSPPVILPDTTRSLTDRHAPALAPFSADGRWVFALVDSAGGKSEIVKVATAPEAVKN